MTFIEICQRVRSEARISGTGPTSVLNQQGQMSDIVRWVQEAYEYVQNHNDNWGFLRKEFYATLTGGLNSYTPNNMGIPDASEWVAGSFRLKYGDSEQFMTQVDYPVFRDNYMIGPLRTQQAAIPTIITVTPDSTLIVFPTPANQNACLYGEYIRRPAQLVANTDVPIFDSKHHMVIVWKAVMSWASSMQSEGDYNDAENKFRMAMFRMERQYNPPVRIDHSYS